MINVLKKICFGYHKNDEESLYAPRHDITDNNGKTKEPRRETIALEIIHHKPHSASYWRWDKIIDLMPDESVSIVWGDKGNYDIANLRQQVKDLKRSAEVYAEMYKNRSADYHSSQTDLRKSQETIKSLQEELNKKTAELNESDMAFQGCEDALASEYTDYQMKMLVEQKEHQKEIERIKRIERNKTQCEEQLPSTWQEEEIAVGEYFIASGVPQDWPEDEPETMPRMASAMSKECIKLREENIRLRHLLKVKEDECETHHPWVHPTEK